MRRAYLFAAPSAVLAPIAWKKLEEHHKAELGKLLEAAGLNGAIDIGSFRRYGSARRLYHFHIDNVGSY